ncbi:hypothetical protein DAPPUDRAFT_305242 [Daphnia pulex]|nr:hypothetical protein DAPPUDRAFT_305242 [Daphnia pulex]|eukprot:EFX78293.1 hypothetical protein DAPPUDRAFT_305242 [Daphnia pulex]
MAPLAIMETRQLPTSLDYRTHACLAAVKNQGQCGNGWAYSAIGSLEFAWCKKYGTPVVLSEQQLVDFDTYDYGCNGGWYINAWNYLKNVAGGSIQQSLYSYTAKKNTLKFASSKTRANVGSYGNLPKLNAPNMQAALKTYGPISVAIAVTDSFANYASGVYTDTACGNVVDHAVVVVGYGKLNVIDYWIVRNSWGTGWGQSGYGFIQRGVNLCHIEEHAAFVTAA